MTLYASTDYAISIAGTVQQGLTSTNIDRVRLYKKLRQVSLRIDHKFGARRPKFAPYDETRKVMLDGQHVNSSAGTLYVGDFMLALSGSVSINGTTISGVEVYPDSSMPPFGLLRLTDCGTSWYSAACSDCSASQQVSVTGTWGFHDDYARAWLQVDALAADINASVTTLTVADVDADDAYGQPNRISPGHLLKIGTEYLDVVDVDASTETVTVIRGANGSTAAAHVATDAVLRWEVMEDVQLATARQALLLYAREGAYVTVDISPMGGEVRYPSDWLSEVMGVLQTYANDG